MADDSHPILILHPREPIEGALAVVAFEEQASEIGRLETDRVRRRYRVQGVVGDTIHLATPLPTLLRECPSRSIKIDERLKQLYVHHGGADAVYYTLRADDEGWLTSVEVKVETALPSRAFLLARAPLNRFLDSLIVVKPLPLVITRLDLVHPDRDEVIASELVYPFNGGLAIGELGGFHQTPLFSPYLVLLREGLTAGTPFYRLLCAWRAFDGINYLRREIRKIADKLKITEPLPKDPLVDHEYLEHLGLTKDFTSGIRTVRDLFDKLTPHRNGVAHFLLKAEEQETHVYLADGPTFATYSYGSAALLRYAWDAIHELRLYYNMHLDSKLVIGSVLPLREHADRFIVRDSTAGDQTT